MPRETAKTISQREALSIARRTLGPEHPETLIDTHNLAGLAVVRKNSVEAEQLFREVVQNGRPNSAASTPLC